MRLDRYPPLFKTGMLLMSGWLRAVHATMDIRFEVPDARADPLRSPRRNIYAFWHETLMLPAYTHGRFVTTLISRHRDGEIIAEVVRLLRGRTIRGSTTRGGAASVRRMMREGRVRHLGITPDGPRGPRRVVQQGVAYVAGRTGMPVVPVGCAYSRCWRAGSWDRMAVPYPFVRAFVVAGLPIAVRPHASREQLAQSRAEIQAAMDAVQARAEALVSGGVRGEDLVPFVEMLRAE